MAEIPDSWEKYGFPDPTFFPPYKPYAGLIKAYNERCSVCGRYPYSVPVFFSKIVGVEYETSLPSTVSYILGNFFDDNLRYLAPYFVNPDKVPAADTIQKCMWTWDDLLLAGADGIKNNIICWIGDYSLSSCVPLWPVKWIIQRYKMINLLRYHPTVWRDPPDFRYEDKNNTFNFKA